MLDTINNAILWPLDMLLGWLLPISPSLVVAIIAVASGSILVLFRRFTTSQDLLARCDADKRRLKELIRAAKANGDREAVSRYKNTRNRIGLKKMRAEGKPLLITLIPIIFIAAWGMQRLEFHPPQAGEPTTVAAFFPLSAVGQVVHIAPREQLTAHTGWIRRIEATEDEGENRGVAIWQISGPAQEEPFDLAIRFDGREYHQPLLIGQRYYAMPMNWHDDRLLRTELQMRPMLFLGIVPGIPAIFFPSWLIGYLLVTIPSVSILKRTLKIH